MDEKSGAPACGMYFSLSHDVTFEGIVQPLRQAAMAINRASGYKKNMNIVELPSAMTRETAKQICEVAQGSGFVVLGLGDPKFAHDIGADGVVLTLADDAKAARDLFGDEGIVGLQVGAGDDVDAGAYDCIVSEGVVPLVGASVSICKAQTDNDRCGALVRAGFDFISCWDYITGYEKGALQAAVNMLHAIDLATQVKSIN